MARNDPFKKVTFEQTAKIPRKQAWGKSILKVEPTEFPNGNEVHYEKKKRIILRVFFKLKLLFYISESVRKIVLSIN